MSLRYCLRHYTHYRYEEPVEQAQNQIRMLLRQDVPGQRVEQRTVRIHPRPAYGKLQDDFFGNRTLYLEVDQPHHDFKLFLKHYVEREAQPATRQSPAWDHVAARLRAGTDETSRRMHLYTLASPKAPLSPSLAAFAAPLFPAGRPLHEAAMALTRHIHRNFKFDPKVTSVTTPVAEVLEKKRGVCQDFAQLMIAALRSLGLAARYVSGYLETLPPPGKTRLVGADASHAWVSVWCPENGWLDFDPTNNNVPGERYLVTAWGRDYEDVIPMNGVIRGGGGKSTLQVKVDVEPQAATADHPESV